MANFIILNANELDKVNGGFIAVSPDSPFYQTYLRLLKLGYRF